MRAPGWSGAAGSAPGHGGTHRVPLCTTSTPTPAGPPHLWALAASTAQPPGTGTRPTDWAASTTRGTPAAAHAAATSATGWTVPTSWLALISAATPTPGSRTAAVNAATSTRPSRSTGTDTEGRSATACRSAECSMAEWTIVAPDRNPSTAAWTASVPLAQNSTSSARTPNWSAIAPRAASSSWRAGRPCG
ncbi:MAG: hypothetical protein AUG44_15750 [Actinobacteria bacterium 13_1_20CM_3_71_11]|nr:MAG: hypothetical protein AUG44_15750 [Actinobacteria bacterium 13_1_20CM_3_71_11]